ncbi:MAG: prolyl oligopeptidase family serine peptidase, partial [Planctomycetaceae bacterium]|nr:prolyl oligopeptidase family serine peptidase [Planctomycetaceae bacterium]
VDDNVHPSNTWQLVKALQDAGKRFDLMVYPNSAHGFRYGSLKWDYFVRHLKPESADGQAEAEQN